MTPAQFRLIGVRTAVANLRRLYPAYLLTSGAAKRRCKGSVLAHFGTLEKKEHSEPRNGELPQARFAMLTAAPVAV